ncbi:hypothetical protein QL285_024489 [Trifolium repens]|nr:hypothetical protein QL285_024489 [Trifolium repens]
MRHHLALTSELELKLLGPSDPESSPRSQRLRYSGSQRIDSQHLVQKNSNRYQRPASLNRLEHPPATPRVLQISPDLKMVRASCIRENPLALGHNHPTPLSHQIVLEVR